MWSAGHARPVMVWWAKPSRTPSSGSRPYGKTWQPCRPLLLPAVAERRQAIRRMVEERCTYPITQDEVALLEEAEQQVAAQTQVEEYKFDSNAAMLAAIDSRKASVA